MGEEVRNEGDKDRDQSVVPIPKMTSRYLHELIAISPYQEPEDLVWWGRDRRTPLQHRQIEDHLYHAMQNVGITSEERGKRNISFHSWRHWCNTILRLRGVDDRKVRMVTGHKTAAMTNNYSHFNVKDFADVVKIQESLFATA